MAVTLACPICGHQETSEKIPPGTTLQDVAIFQCNGCGNRTIHGKTLPRMVVEPFVDARGFSWVRRRFQDPRTKQDLYVVDIDPKWAVVDATNVLSIVGGE